MYLIKVKNCIRDFGTPVDVDNILVICGCYIAVLQFEPIKFLLFSCAKLI